MLTATVNEYLQRPLSSYFAGCMQTSLTATRLDDAGMASWAAPVNEIGVVTRAPTTPGLYRVQSLDAFCEHWRVLGPDQWSRYAVHYGEPGVYQVFSRDTGVSFDRDEWWGWPPMPPMVEPRGFALPFGRGAVVHYQPAGRRRLVSWDTTHVPAASAGPAAVVNAETPGVYEIRLEAPAGGPAYVIDLVIGAPGSWLPNGPTGPGHLFAQALAPNARVLLSIPGPHAWRWYLRGPDLLEATGAVRDGAISLRGPGEYELTVARSWGLGTGGARLFSGLLRVAEGECSAERAAVVVGQEGDDVRGALGWQRTGTLSPLSVRTSAYVTMPGLLVRAFTEECAVPALTEPPPPPADDVVSLGRGVSTDPAAARLLALQDELDRNILGSLRDVAPALAGAPAGPRYVFDDRHPRPYRVPAGAELCVQLPSVARWEPGACSWYLVWSPSGEILSGTRSATIRHDANGAAWVTLHTSLRDRGAVTAVLHVDGDPSLIVARLMLEVYPPGTDMPVAMPPPAPPAPPLPDGVLQADSVARAMRVLEAEIWGDPQYRDTWAAVIIMAIVEAGVSQEVAEDAATRILQTIFAMPPDYRAVAPETLSPPRRRVRSVT